MPASPVKWNQRGVETNVNDEDKKIQKVQTLVNRIQGHNFSDHRGGFRGTRVKTQAVVKGSMYVLPDLPAHLRQGLFSNGGNTFPLAIRYANEPIKIQDDRTPGPRGCGMKVFDVEGPGGFLDPIGDTTHTQDFTFNNAPMLELKDLETTPEIFTLRERYFHGPDTLTDRLKQRPDSELQLAPGTLPNHHFLAYTMYSQSAYRYGEYVAKYALFPTS